MLFWAEQGLEVYPELVGVEFGSKWLLLLTDLQVHLFLKKRCQLIIWRKFSENCTNLGWKEGQGTRPKIVYVDLSLVNKYPCKGLSSWYGNTGLSCSLLICSFLIWSEVLLIKIHKYCPSYNEQLQQNWRKSIKPMLPKWVGHFLYRINTGDKWLFHFTFIKEKKQLMTISSCYGYNS